MQKQGSAEIKTQQQLVTVLAAAGVNRVCAGDNKGAYLADSLLRQACAGTAGFSLLQMMKQELLPMACESDPQLVGCAEGQSQHVQHRLSIW